MMITKMALPRRTFLRGMGAAVALPLLDAMVPALSAMARTAAIRSGAGVCLHSDGYEPGDLDSRGGGQTDGAVAVAGVAHAVSGSLVRGDESRSEKRGGRGGQPRDSRLGLPELRSGEADRGQRLRVGHDGRSDRRAASGK